MRLDQHESSYDVNDNLRAVWTLDVYAQPCSRSTAWTARFRRRRSARCCIKRSGHQIGDHLEELFADFGISRPLSSLGALLGIAQILGGFRTHGAAGVDVHSGTSHTWGRCLILAHSMPWFGHTVQNRDTARDVWKTPLHFSNGPFSCQWSRIKGSAVNMATDDECVRVAHEYARLAGLTKHQNVRDQLLDLARGWTAVAQHERRSDARVLHFTPATTSPETQQRSRRQSKLPISRSRDMTLSPHWFAPRRVRD